MDSNPPNASHKGISLRPGTLDDGPAILRLMDIATQWLVQQGNTEQWGSGTHSDRPDRIEQMAEFAESGVLWVAVDDAIEPQSTVVADNPNKLIGAVCVGKAVPYVAPATEPELYITLLITDRAYKGRGIGTLLLEKARALAREAGVSLLRVDCYRGPDEGLVRYYEAQGFERVETFMAKGVWPGQLLMQRLS